MEPIYLDTETTGLSQGDEIVEIGILDDDGKVLLDTVVKPIHHADWPDAQAIHGIAPEMVRGAPTLDELRDTIVNIVRGRDVVIYHAAYDSQYLQKELASAASIECCMLAYAKFRDEWSEYWENYHWYKLTDAAASVLHEWRGPCHRAVADCEATRAVWRYLNDPQERQRVDALIADKEAGIEAERELYWLQHRIKTEQDRFRDEKSAEWMQRWGFSAKRLHFQERNVRELEYYHVFTGMDKKIWGLYSRYKDTIPMIESLKDVPKYCIGRKEIDALPPHLQQAMSPCLFYLSQSRKTFRLFYDTRELTKLRWKLRRRKYRVYERYEDVPADLMSKSQLKKRGINVEKEGMEPQAEYYFRCQHGNRYVLLYRSPQQEV